MASIARKKNISAKPVVALLSQVNWVQEQLTLESWRHNRGIARKIVNSLSENEIRELPESTHQQLMGCLKAGRITNEDSKAIKKLLISEVKELEYQQRISIKGKKDFIEITTLHLAKLSSIPLGRKLLCSLYKSGKQVLIVATDRVSEAPPDDFRAAIPRGKRLKWQDLSGKEISLNGNGRGSDTTIKYNPYFTCSSGRVDWRKYPPEIALAHELIHADDSAYGRLDPEEVDGIRNYERQAVGLSPYDNKEFTENKFRATWSPPISPRTQY